MFNLCIMCIYGFHWNVDNCSVMEMIFAKYVHQIKNAELQTCLRLLKGQNFSFKLLLRKKTILISAGALIVITPITHPTFCSVSSSAHSNCVLTFPNNNIYRHACYCLRSVKQFEQYKQCKQCKKSVSVNSVKSQSV